MRKILQLVIFVMSFSLCKAQIQPVDVCSQPLLPKWQISSLGNGNVLFPNINACGRDGLYTSDGTTQGTVNIMPGNSNFALNTYNQWKCKIGDTWYFVPNPWELWKTNGTVLGTVLVKSFGFRIEDLVNLNGTLIFRAQDPNTGYELWKSDGTSEGTIMITDLSTGPINGVTFPLCKDAILGNYLYFSGPVSCVANCDNDGQNPQPIMARLLYKTDGTAAGTTVVPNGGYDPGVDFNVVNQTLVYRATTFYYYFCGGENIGLPRGTIMKVAADGSASILKEPDLTREPWYCGEDKHPVGQNFSDFTTYNRLIKTDNYIYFKAQTTPVNYDNNSIAHQIWRTDGTLAGTIPVTDFPAGTRLNEFQFQPSTFTTENEFNAIYYFVVDTPETGYEAWRSDGTPAGTYMLKDIYPGPNSALPSEFQTVGSWTYFMANDGIHGFELWKTDGTNAGTELVQDLNPGPAHGFDHPGMHTNAYNYDNLFNDGFLNSSGDILYMAGSSGHVGGLFKLDTKQTAATAPANYSYISGTYHVAEKQGERYIYIKEVDSPTVPGLKETVKIYFDGTQWVWELAPTVLSGRTTATILATNPSLSSPNAPCSGWTNDFGLAGSGCNISVLPVTLTKFTAVPYENNSSLLNWTTTSETNSHHFAIEHSANAIHWQRIGEVASKGESSQLVNYDYTHTNPTYGENYYRLKQTDKDGTFAYSRIVSVNLANIEGKSFLYPNPVSDRLFIKDLRNITRVEIFNLTGQIVLEVDYKLYEGIPLQGVPTGMYLVKMLGANGISRTEKILVEK